MHNSQLDTFVVVAECGSFTKASESLKISPTAIMKQINSLEEHLDVTLFGRTNHGLRLTEAGESVLQDAKYMVDYSTRAVEKARNIDYQHRHKSILVGTSVMTPAKFIMDMWMDIQRLLPDLKIELISFENTPENIARILKNLGRPIDVVAGIYDEHQRETHDFDVAYLCDKKVNVAVPISSPLAQKEILKPEDLKESGILLVKNGWNGYIDGLRSDLKSIGVNVVDFDSFNPEIFNRAASENMPIIAVEGWDNVHPLLKIMPVDWEYNIPYGVMYSRQPSRQVSDFIDAINQITKERAKALV
jgi:DNA-binding transcriptional LysR family regulator